MSGIFANLVSQFSPMLGFNDWINDFFGHINHAIAAVFFFDVLFFVDELTLPLTVVWLVCGAVFFTFLSLHR